ncbi:Plant-specific transcription factor YABBY family protein [Heracleum sosnowskyi]|uniref:Plant-specific transcription factor YABBY family protein n=1 Tax=Heracleum sosnowskyi TaxID=360622 RepID=A0AAD8MNZ9_9APIA|nr:Plant-specific transcription factor YABBY family protein [Heracleum sosnowskyi]
MANQVPCLHCHPDRFIRMVQHMIERCLLLNMSREDCIAALREHANIDPVITITVWEELRKENTSFFESYDIHAVSSSEHDSIISSISGDSGPNEAESELRKENKIWSDQEEISSCQY